MTLPLLSNTGGSVLLFVIAAKETQTCMPCIQDIPTRANGQKIDTSLYVLGTRKMNLRVRLTATEKTTLQAIYAARTQITLTMGSWSFSGYLKNKNLKFENVSDNLGGGEINRDWLTNLELIITSFSYSGSSESGNTEFLSNTGFESDFTSWTNNGAEISIDQYHGGAKSCYFSDDGDPDAKYVEQTVVNVPVSSITAFSYWKRGHYSFSPTWGSKTEVTITYTDNTTTIVEHETDSGHDYVWEEVDLLSSLEAGKIVKKIRIRRSDDYYGFACRIDDVQMIGLSGDIQINSYGFTVIDMNVDDTTTIFTPTWLNTSPSLDTSVWNKEIEEVSYTVRATHYGKWVLDQVLIGHVLVNLTDDHYGIDTNVWMREISIEHDQTNRSKPWKITVSLLISA